MIGRHLSHYEVLEELGHGGMGVVYKARDTSLDRLVALKVLPPQLAQNRDRIALLEREARASAKLNHPRIVTIYSVERVDGLVFLTMEYIKGRTLDKAIPKHGFDLDRFFRIAIPLADALGAAHEKRIVHRDLKPANIILSKEDRPKILDFGLARLRPDEGAAPGIAPGEMVDSDATTQLATLEGKLAGTVPYMSPEQLSRGPVDHRTDIFSLGIVFYEMATGRHPYRSKEGSVVSAILEDRPVSVADVRTALPRQLGRIVRHCLEKNPEQRAQSAKDLRNDLEDLRRELSTRAGRGPPRPLRRWRRSAPPALLAAIILAAAGWLIYNRFVDDFPPPPPYYLAVEEARIFPGDRGPDYLRRGLLDSLRGQMTTLEGIYVVGEEGPIPDLTVLADARKSSDTVALGFRLVESGSTITLGDAVLEGDAADLPDLVTRASRTLALTLGEELGPTVSYRAARPPTTDTVAFDLYLQAVAAAEPDDDPADAARVQELLQSAVERDPKFALAHLLAGQQYLRRAPVEPAAGLAATAETRCRAAARADPRLGAAYTCLGEALMLQDRTLEAVAALDRAIELDTFDLTPHLTLREAYLDLGLPDEAERTWSRLVKKHPDYWAGYYSLGTYYQDVERYADSLEQYQEASRLAPREPGIHSYIGTTYFYLGRYEEATVALENSIDIRPTRDAYYRTPTRKPCGSTSPITAPTAGWDGPATGHRSAARTRPDTYGAPLSWPTRRIRTQ
jgi:tetratricopeptide (TPR) repeat protein/predicted Ser/Thr protein kinase